MVHNFIAFCSAECALPGSIMEGQKATYRIMDLEESERPRERLARLGVGALSREELLAILLRTGVKGESAIALARHLLDEMGGLQGIHRAEFAQLMNFKGIGEAKACQILAAIELGRRLVAEEPKERMVIQSPQQAADLVKYEMMGLEQECLRVILLDVRNRLIKVAEVYMGSTSQSQVRVGELFRSAIRYNASSVIVVHNHPSGDPSPSPDDVAVTRAIVQAGKLLDIDVLDHLVIGHNRFVSLKERGLGFG